MTRPGMTFLLIFAIGAVPSAHSPYAGQQTREIKSLDAATIEALQKGEGHGMAMAGELNHYPGPRHVLAMAAHLQMTGRQEAETKIIYDRMHTRAVSLGIQIIEKERRLDLAFKNGSITDKTLGDLTTQIADLNGRLRYVHLSAHLAMKRILTPGQIRMYDAMRGYGQGTTGMEH